MNCDKTPCYEYARAFLPPYSNIPSISAERTALGSIYTVCEFALDDNERIEEGADLQILIRYIHYVAKLGIDSWPEAQ